MVRGHNNYFFDLAKGSIMVGSYQTQCNTTNSASNLGIAIPDGTSVQATTTLNVTDSYTISDVNISVNISHGYVRDLRIIAESPQGTEVVLWSHNCGNQDNVVITFDDSGSALDCSNLTGTHVAVGSLSDFAGENCQGTWTLKVDDNYSGTAGTINNWSVEVCQTVNVNENTISNLKVWPNPTQNNVNIAFDVKDTNSNINVSLFDLSGREIFSNNYETEADYFNKNIGINDLSKGLYLLKIKNGKYMSTQKLFIK
jgi:subtilisin-like proprotein convertase family protein